MNAITFFATLLLLSHTQTFAALTLQEALKTNKVKVKLTSNGKSLEEGMITADIHNISMTRLDLTIPVATKLNASSDDRQNLVLVQEEVFALAPNSKKTLDLKGMCIQAENMSPGEDVAYTLGDVLQGDIAECAKRIHKNKLINSCGQEAIWAFSDNHDVGWINANSEQERALRQFVADKKGVANPWYTTAHQAGNNQLSANYNPTQPVSEYYQRSAAEIKGDFRWKQNTAKRLTFGVYDASGQLIRKFFENKTFEQGEFTFNFYYKTTQGLNGTYYARLTAGNEVVQEAPFTF